MTKKLKAAAHAIDVRTAAACPWQACNHSRCMQLRNKAATDRAALGLVRDPSLITLHQANLASQDLIERSRRKKNVEDDANKLIERIQHAIDHNAFDSVALVEQLLIVHQAVRESKS